MMRNHTRCCTRRRLGRGIVLLFSLWLMLPDGMSVNAQAADKTLPVRRELFVPFSDLPIILGGKNQRVFMERAEYERMRRALNKQQPDHAPVKATVTQADYHVTIEGTVATIQGTLELAVTEPGIHAVGLDLRGVRPYRARLDGKPAPLGLGPKGRIDLFVDGLGAHRLELELQAPVAVAAAQQSLSFQLAWGTSSTLQLDVPGNVEVKGGASVIERQYDEPKNATHFRLLPQRSGVSIAMSLNNRRLLRQQVVIARSVLVAELTSTYERLHASVLMDVLHGAAEQFVFEVPSGFQVTSVACPQLAQWKVRTDQGKQLLEIALRQPVREAVTVNIAATRAPVKIGAWTMPKLQVRDVSGQVAVVGLLAESRLQPLDVTTRDLLQIDTSVLRNALPASVFAAAPGAPEIRPLVAYYAPSASYALAATLTEPADKLRVATHLMLALDENQQILRGGFTLMPQGRKQRVFSFELPGLWVMQKIHAGDNKAIPFERYRGAKTTRYVVRLSQGIEPGKSTTVYFESNLRTSAWLSDWTDKEVEFPQVRVENAQLVTGAIAVQPQGDLTVRPDDLTGLAPLDSSQRSRFGLAANKEDLAYQVRGDSYRGVFRVTRIVPQVTCRNYAFFQVQQGVLKAHYELFFEIARAHTKRLQFALPAATPEAIAVSGLDGVALKEYVSTLTDDQRLWDVRLAKPSQGTVHLAVDFEQRADAGAVEGWEMPLARARDVRYQTQMVAVEGDPALDIMIKTPMRPVDVGELAETKYVAGRRLLGAYASTTDVDRLRLDVKPRDLHPLPAAIVQRAELVTLVSRQGIGQSVARYQLRTKVPLLAVRLPAQAELWSAIVDHKPVRPQQRGDQILVSLPADTSNTARDLQIVYQAPLQSFGWIGRVDTPAPQLWLVQDEADQGVPVPQVDLIWRVHLPKGYQVSRADGNVFSTQVVRPKLPFERMARRTAALGGGVVGPPLAGRARLARRDVTAARAAAMAQMGVDDVDFEAATAEEAKSEDSSSASSHRYSVPNPPAAATADPFGGRVQRNLAVPPKRRRTSTLEGLELSDEADAAERPDQLGDAMGGAGGESSMGSGGMLGGGMGGGGMAGGGYGAPGSANGPQRSGYAGMPGGDRQADASRSSGSALLSKGVAPNQSGAQMSAPAKKGKIAKYWALQGIRGLRIKVEDTGKGVTFRSLGETPHLAAVVFDGRRMNWLAAAAGLLVVVFGLGLVRRSVTTRIAWLAMIILPACLLAAVGGPVTEFMAVLEMIIIGAIVLVPVWVFFAFCGTLRDWLQWPARIARWALHASTVVLVSIVMLGGNMVQAQTVDDIIKALDKVNVPLVIPDNAVVIPYDPANPNSRNTAARVLVPYAEYERLWKMAHPETKAVQLPNSAQFATAGADYQLTLSDEDQVELVGALDIVVYGNAPVQVPLSLAGGVISAASLDGKPAQLAAVVAAAPPARKAQQQQRVALPPMLTSVLVTGQGRHRLEVTVRVAVDRQGGWRRVTAAVPSSVATSVTITVPSAGTQVTRTMAGTVTTQTTDRPNQRIAAAVDPGGSLQLSWRPRISAGDIDQALTAESLAVVDVGEDGMHAVWRIDFNFGQAQRNALQVVIPQGLSVEKVLGKNVRGWAVGNDAGVDGGQVLSIDLLKAVKQHERVTLRLARRMPLAGGDSAAVDVPVVTVVDAALHRGTIRVRRSPVLDVQVAATSGVARADVVTLDKEMQALVSETPSPLGMQDFQAYRFNATPFQVRLSADVIAPRAVAEVRTLLRVGETEAALECQLRMRAERRARYVVQVAIPPELELKQVDSAALSDWTVRQIDERRVLTVFLNIGQVGSFSIAIQGQLPDHTPQATIALPQLEVLNVERQSGALVIQADASLDVRLTELTACRSVLLDRVTGWLTAAQRAVARLAVDYRTVPYSGKVTLAPRAARITCDTISNVRLTYREIQETILLDFNITQAGTRQLRFQLPDWMKDAQITAPVIRQQTVTPVAGAKRVRVELELQDAVMGDYRVIVQNDRALTPGKQTAPVPVVESGTTNYRYVTLENAGRDEVVASDVEGLQAVQRQSRPWQFLATRLQGSDLTSAYVTTDSNADVRISYATKRRAVVKTAGANIGLALTELALDEGGAYRAVTMLKVNNRTEPYLEIEMPEGATLWTAHVADQPVKPARAIGQNTQRRLRVPLVKTATGDLDYAVVLKYGGTIGRLATLRSVQFPVLKTVNINIELSQVELRLPDNYHWYQFDGTVERAAGESDFLAGYVAYRTRQVEGLTQVLRGKDFFSASRAYENVKNLEKEFASLQRRSNRMRSNVELQQNVDRNAQAFEAARQEMAQVDKSKPEAIDNRRRLNELYVEQKAVLSRNQVLRLGQNFARSAGQQGQQQAESQQAANSFDGAFFKQTVPQTAVPADRMPKGAKKPSAATLKAQTRLGRSRSWNMPQQAAEPAADEAALNVFRGLNGKLAKPQSGLGSKSSRGESTRLEGRLKRAYTEQLQRKNVDRLQAFDDAGVDAGEALRESDHKMGARPALTPATPGAGGDAGGEALATGLASLDFALPKRGKTFYFAGARGDVDLTARPVSDMNFDRMLSLVGFVIFGLVLWSAAIVVRRANQSVVLMVLLSALLGLAGFLMIILIILPIYGLAAFAAAVMLMAHAIHTRRLRAAAAKGVC